MNRWASVRLFVTWCVTERRWIRVGFAAADGGGATEPFAGAVGAWSPTTGVVDPALMPVITGGSLWFRA